MRFGENPERFFGKMIPFLSECIRIKREVSLAFCSLLWYNNTELEFVNDRYNNILYKMTQNHAYHKFKQGMKEGA